MGSKGFPVNADGVYVQEPDAVSCWQANRHDGRHILDGSTVTDLRMRVRAQAIVSFAAQSTL